MFGFKKKNKGPIMLSLTPEQLYRRVPLQSIDHAPSAYVPIDETQFYAFLIQDGSFKGLTRALGGALYPFSPDPSQQCSKGEMKDIKTADVILVRKDFRMLVKWGTKPHQRFHIEDPNDKAPYSIGARGTFEVSLNPMDVGEDANQFFRQLVAPYQEFDSEALKDRLAERFLQEVGRYIEAMIIEEKRSLENYVGLGPSALAQIADILLPKMRNIFGDYAMTLTVMTVNGLAVDPE